MFNFLFHIGWSSFFWVLHVIFRVRKTLQRYERRSLHWYYKTVLKLFVVCLECFWIGKFLCKANKLSYQFNNAFKSFLQVEVFSLSHRSTGIKDLVKRQINSFNCIWLSLITQQRLILTHNIWSSDALKAAPLVRGHSNLCQHFRV